MACGIKDASRLTTSHALRGVTDFCGLLQCGHAAKHSKEWLLIGWVKSLYIGGTILPVERSRPLAPASCGKPKQRVLKARAAVL